MENHDQPLNEKVDVDARTGVFRRTMTRLEQSRAMREAKSNKYAGMYDDGSGRGAFIPKPITFNQESKRFTVEIDGRIKGLREALKRVEMYRKLREEKKKTLYGTKKESVEETDDLVESLVGDLVEANSTWIKKPGDIIIGDIYFRPFSMRDYNDTDDKVDTRGKVVQSGYNIYAKGVVSLNSGRHRQIGTVYSDKNTVEVRIHNELGKGSNTVLKIAKDSGFPESTLKRIAKWMLANPDKAKMNEEFENLHEGIGMTKGQIMDAIDRNSRGWVVKEEELSPAQKKYRKFFDGALKKFGAKSPADLDDAGKKKLFNYIKKNYKG
jgi:hypothetical protein